MPKKRRIFYYFFAGIILLSVLFAGEEGVFNALLKPLVQWKIESVFSADVKIGQLDGGFFHEIVLDNVKIYPKFSPWIRSITTEKLEINVYLHKLLLSKEISDIGLNFSQIQIDFYPVKKRNLPKAWQDMFVTFKHYFVKQSSTLKLKYLSYNKIFKDKVSDVYVFGEVGSEKQVNRFLIKQKMFSHTGRCLTQVKLPKLDLVIFQDFFQHLKLFHGALDVEMYFDSNQLVKMKGNLNDLSIQELIQDKIFSIQGKCHYQMGELVLDEFSVFSKEWWARIAGTISELPKNMMLKLNMQYSFEGKSPILLSINNYIHTPEVEFVIENDYQGKFSIQKCNWQSDALWLRGCKGNIKLKEHSINWGGDFAIESGRIKVDSIRLPYFYGRGDVFFEPILSWNLKGALQFDEHTVQLKKNDVHLIGQMTPLECKILHHTAGYGVDLKGRWVVDENNLHSELSLTYSNDKTDLSLQAKLESTSISDEKVLFKVSADKILLREDELPSFYSQLEWWKKEQKLFLDPIQWKDYLLGKGTIDIAQNQIDLSIMFQNTDLSKFMFLAKANAQNLVSGTMNGSININGELTYPQTKGNVELTNGHFLHLNYENANINLEGQGAVIDLVNSRVNYDGKSALLTGYLNFKNENIFSTVKFASDEKSVMIKGIDFVRQQGGTGVEMTKKVTSNVYVSMTTGSNDLGGAGLIEGQDKPSFQIDYGINDDDDMSLTLQVDENEEMIGLKKEIKF